MSDDYTRWPGHEAVQLGRELDLVAMLAEDPPEPDWLLPGLLEYGELAWLSGRGKTGKSMVALYLMGACLTAGGTFIGRSVGAIDWGLYLDAENPQRVVHRRVHMAGLTTAAAMSMVYRSIRGIDLGSPAGIDALRRLVGDRDGRGLVVLDSLVALRGPIDSWRDNEVRGFVDKLRAVFEEFGVTAIGLGHDNRSGNMAGSLDWRNSVDRAIELTKKDDGSRTLSNGDVRDGPDDEGDLGFTFVAERTQDGRLRLLMEPVEASATKGTRTKAEQLADQIVLLLTGVPTLSKAKVALRLGFGRDHGTFKRAWDKASRVLAEQGGQSGPGH